MCKLILNTLKMAQISTHKMAIGIIFFLIEIANLLYLDPFTKIGIVINIANLELLLLLSLLFALFF